MSYSEKMLDQLEAGQMEAAKKSFAWALRKDDDDTLFNLAEQLYGLGFLHQAQRIYLKLLDKYPDEDEIKTSLAEIAIDGGHNDEALAYLSQVPSSSPAYLQSLLVAADLYQTEEQFEVTEEKLREAYEIAPTEPAVLFALGEFYYLVAKYDQAIPLYIALIKQGYTEFAKVDIAGRLGMAYAQSGKFTQALGYLEQVDPQYQTSDIRFQTGLTQLHLGKLTDAIETLKDLIDYDDQYASAYPALASAYAQNNQFKQALTTAQEGLGVDQYNEQLFAQAADIASHLGDYKLMDKYLKAAHELDPENMTIALQYSNFLLQQQRYQDNIDLLSPFIKEHEVDPQLEWNLAQSYMELEQFDKAGKAFETALPTYQDNPEFLRQLIDYYQQTGQHDQLVDELEHYVELVPTDTEMIDLLDSYQNY
ncbi:tetratricopeptide repeat protein [Limosilactobacillus coleohominis]|jgi:tetratricopeptide (TPR) repeat protein|uniref:tetratricopeptide repeat protein n=1 Tax=Limosilactobacillus coleohominis TaxID=181675 RepID=UPI0015C0F0D8|nr:tetratricopeptide repeat protein [Limosilactobacillus coleohominis]MDY5628324.1 tetratricopeptide repeat protein [Limosilactobacillus coleohominis]